MRITRKLRNLAVDLIRREHPKGTIQGVDVESLAKMLTVLKAHDKPRIVLKGVFIIEFSKNENGEVDAGLITDCSDRRGRSVTPSAEFAEWMLHRAAETAKTSLPTEADEE